MSLYGALSSGVSGLKSQANKIGIISDNISNVNTVGFKRGDGAFETLVTSSGTVAYAPGGVLGNNRKQISEQGLLVTTNSNTDIAISGKGMFVVNTAPDSSGTVYYSRAGSFRQDSTGNFQNAAGYYLQGWPLDREGRLPGASGNSNTTSSTSLTSLQTVNVQSLTGVAASTTRIELSANLKSQEVAYSGSGAETTMDINSVANFEISAQDVIVPTSVNNLERDDRFQITTGNGLTYTYRYGGFTFGRDITSGAVGDNEAALPTSPVTLGNNPFTTTNASTTVSVRHGNHGLQTGDVVTFSGVTAAIGGIPAADFNDDFVITVTSEDTYTITTASTATSGTSGGGTVVAASIRPFPGNIFDATTASTTFLGITGTTGFTAESLKFTVTTAATGTVTFEYVTGTPNAQLGQFNSLNNLASAIAAVDGLTSRVVNNRLYISAIDANQSITFANVDDTGEGAGNSLKSGIDWVGELGLKNVSTGTNRFATLQGLEDIVNDSPGLSAEIANPDSNSTLEMFVDDPLDTITFSDYPVSTGNTIFSSAESPVGTTSGSTAVTITHSSAHGFSNGDIVTLDPTAMANWPTTTSATNAFATTNGSSTITITDTAHGFTTGDSIYFDTTGVTGFPTGNINGIPMHELKDTYTVTVLTANTYTIAVNSSATSTGSAGAGSFIASPTLNGIPLTKFNDSFEIRNVTSTSYTITLPDAATSTGSLLATGLEVENPTNGGSVIAELGLVDSLDSGGFTVEQTTGALGPAYDAADATKNMASGSITPQYFTNVRVYDSLGTGHDLRTAFIKTSVNTWAVEVYAVPETDVSTSYANGQIASGTIIFNGDGSLRSVESTLTGALDITWENGASPSEITLDWGTSGALGNGLTDGLSQFDANYKLNFANQNGVPVGELIGVEISDLGIVTARFNNGESQDIFKIPMADFANPDGLDQITGNVFAETNNSGTVNLREAGTSGTGTMQASTLESSNADVAQQLTDMIVAQRAYQANTKVITTTDQLLEELSRIIS